MAPVSVNEGVNEAIISLAAGSSFTEIRWTRRDLDQQPQIEYEEILLGQSRWNKHGFLVMFDKLYDLLTKASKLWFCSPSAAVIPPSYLFLHPSIFSPAQPKLDGDGCAQMYTLTTYIYSSTTTLRYLCLSISIFILFASSQQLVRGNIASETCWI